MPGKRSRIICPHCSALGGFGGVLTLRKVGNAIDKKFFYIKHYAKHKIESCYIGRAGMLAYVTLLDERYDMYEKSITITMTQVFKELDLKEQNDLKLRLVLLLVDMGFPAKFCLHKYIADRVSSFLEKKYKHPKALKDGQFNSELNSAVDEILRGTKFEQGLTLT